MDYLLPLIVNLVSKCSDFQALYKAAEMKREKLTQITKNAVAAVHKSNLKETLQNTKFAILFDESTDVSVQKHGCIIVRYFSHELKKVVSALRDLYCRSRRKNSSGSIPKNFLFFRKF